VRNLLIDEMRDEGSAAAANTFVITLESLAELYNQAIDQKLSDLWQLCVHNSSHRGVNWRKW
jgi:hypothetical protein